MTAPALSIAAADVRRVHRPPVSDFDALANGPAAPVVLTGCLEQWPLVADLQRASTPDAQLDLLDTIVGARRLRYTRVAPKHHGHLGYTDDGKATTFEFNANRKVPFTEFSQVLRASVANPERGAVYMQSVPLDRFPELLSRVPDLPYLVGGAAGYRQIWIGSGGHVVNLHFDPTHNLIAMLAGEKRITLVPPRDLASMYPAPLDRRLGDAIGSRVRLLAPDPQKFPKAMAALANAQVATLGPGDVLYIPPMWWHHVESFGLNVMINKWVPPIPGAQFGDLTANIVRGILAFGQMPQAERMRYRSLYLPLFSGGAPAPSTTGHDNAANRHLLETARVLRGIPDCLLSTLPQLYDYYVFHTDGEPSLSADDPERFTRSLRRYCRLMRVMQSIRSIFATRSTSPIPRQ